MDESPYLRMLSPTNEININNLSLNEEEEKKTATIQPSPSPSHLIIHQDEEQKDYNNVPPTASTSSSSSSSSSSSPPYLIAFVNFHSGGQSGVDLLHGLISSLGKENVFDLKGEGGPKKRLEQYKNYPNLRVIIGGGDGTLNWVLSCMRSLGMHQIPVGMLPLGTGNDTSRAFGWGFKFEGEKKVHKNIERMRSCLPSDMITYDRWHVLAQYDVPADAEMAEGLPASLQPVRKSEDIPVFVRHQIHEAALPPFVASSSSSSSSLPPAPLLPDRAVSIDVDAKEQGYNVQAVPLQVLNSNQNDDASSSSSSAPPLSLPLPSHVPSSSSSSSSSSDSSSVAPRDMGPGRVFGAEWNNYLSWGCDAQTQGQFHHAREGCRICFCARPCNMTWMGICGAYNFCCCTSKKLDVSVEIKLNNGTWVNIPLPDDLRALVLLNTPTYGGGRFLWGKDKKKKSNKNTNDNNNSSTTASSSSSSPPPRRFECINSTPPTLSDGLFEIIGIRSTLHLGLIMGHFTRGIRLAQAHEARITHRGIVYAQADGEPYIDRPGTYHIRPLQPMTIMTRKEKVVHMTK